MSALCTEGYELGRLLKCAGMARPSYYHALSHPTRPTRPELRGAVTEIFSRTANGYGHRQVAMCLCAELGAHSRQDSAQDDARNGGHCGVCLETDHHRYNSYKGVVDETFKNVIEHDFAAVGPSQKMGTDLTEFKQTRGKTYFAPVCGFGSKEIVAWSTSRCFSERRMAEIHDAVLRMGAAGEHDWTKLEKTTKKIIESKLELVDNVGTP